MANEDANLSSTARRTILVLLLAPALSGASGVTIQSQPIQQPVPSASDERDGVILIQGYTDGLSGVRAANPDVHLNVGRDPSLPGEPVLFVEYAAPTSDPAGRAGR